MPSNNNRIINENVHIPLYPIRINNTSGGDLTADLAYSIDYFNLILYSIYYFNIDNFLNDNEKRNIFNHFLKYFDINFENSRNINLLIKRIKRKNYVCLEEIDTVDSFFKNNIDFRKEISQSYRVNYYKNDSIDYLYRVDSNPTISNPVYLNFKNETSYANYEVNNFFNYKRVVNEFILKDKKSNFWSTSQQEFIEESDNDIVKSFNLFDNGFSEANFIRLSYFVKNRNKYDKIYNLNNISYPLIRTVPNLIFEIRNVQIKLNENKYLSEGLNENLIFYAYINYGEFFKNIINTFVNSNNFIFSQEELTPDQENYVEVLKNPYAYREVQQQFNYDLIPTEPLNFKYLFPKDSINDNDNFFRENKSLRNLFGFNNFLTNKELESVELTKLTAFNEDKIKPLKKLNEEIKQAFQYEYNQIEVVFNSNLSFPLASLDNEVNGNNKIKFKSENNSNTYDDNTTTKENVSVKTEEETNFNLVNDDVKTISSTLSQSQNSPLPLPITNIPLSALVPTYLKPVDFTLDTYLLSNTMKPLIRLLVLSSAITNIIAILIEFTPFGKFQRVLRETSENNNQFNGSDQDRINLRKEKLKELGIINNNSKLLDNPSYSVNELHKLLDTKQRDQFYNTILPAVKDLTFSFNFTLNLPVSPIDVFIENHNRLKRDADNSEETPGRFRDSLWARHYQG